MVVLILVALWIVVLTPGAVRWLRERQPTESIDSFHQQLHLLERTGPKLVEPAYRLESVQSRTGVAVGQSGLPSVSSRPGGPNLVLLPPADEGTSSFAPAPARAMLLGGATGDGVADGDGVAGGGVAGGGVAGGGSSAGYSPMLSTDPPGWTGRAYGEPGARPAFQNGPPVGRGWASKSPEDARRRRLAQRRRRTLILWTAGILVLTAMLGAIPSLHALWVVTGLTALGLAGYVGLVAYAQLLESERQPPASWHRSEAQFHGDDYEYSASRGAPAGPFAGGGRMVSAYGRTPGWDGVAGGTRSDGDEWGVADAERVPEHYDRRVALGR